MMWLRVVALAIVLVQFANSADARRSSGNRFLGVYVVTMNTVARIADPSREVAETALKTLLSAGTKIIVYKKIKNSIGYMFLSENGIWGFIDESAFWEKFAPVDFGFEHSAVAITRPTTVILGSDVLLKLGTSTTWELIDQGPLSLTIRITGDRNPVLPDNFVKDVKVLRNSARIIETDSAFTRQSVDFFTKGIVDKFSEFLKRCNESRVQKIARKAAIGFGINWNGFTLGLDASDEVQTILEFEKDEFVRRLYFTRAKSGGNFTLTEFKQCEDSNGKKRGEIWFHYVNGEGNFVDIHRDWANRNGLKIKNGSGQIIITCYSDYDKYFAALKDEDLPNDEIHFVISRTARWRTGESIRICTDQ